MANWITVTANDVGLTTAEKNTMTALAPGEDLAACVLNAANLARGYIPPPREAAPSVPPECKDDVIAIARATYLSQDSTGRLLTEARQKQRDDAIAHLRDIAKGLVTVTAADVVVQDAQTKGSIAVADQKCSPTQTDRVVTRDRLGGL